MTLTAGTRLGSYEIVAPLGAGGMGELYRARDPRLGRDVAIKLLPAELSGNRDRMRRLEAEARAASALNHPNVVTIHEIGASDARPYIVMELVAGSTLRELLADGPLGTRRLLAIAVQVAEGLAKAHAAGIVHRDLKPENLMVNEDGLVKILDFGLAKLTQPELPSSEATEAATASVATEPGVVMGTVGYMSPEQALGKPLDYRSDQFSFGAILYELATGRRAFLRASTPETLSAIIRDEPEPIGGLAPRTPGPLRWIIERCLSKEPRQRYASTEDLARELASIRDHLPELSASGEAATARDTRRGIGIRLWLALAGALAVAVTAGILAGRRLAASPPPTFKPVTFGRGTIVSARFASDGETVVYTAAWDGRRPQLFLKRPDSADEVPIPLPSAVLFAISRSGELAFALGCTSTLVGACSASLARAPITGGTPRLLAENVQEADWAPDGDRLAVTRAVGGQTTLEFPIGKKLYETTGTISDPRVSPDASRIAFVDHPLKSDSRGSVAILDLAGRKRTLTREWDGIGGLAWSGSGGEVWFTAATTSDSDALHAVSLSGRERLVARFPLPIGLMDLSRSGRVLFTQGVARLAIAGRTANEPRERELGWLEWSAASDISRDGKTLLFDESSGAAGAGYAVCTRGMDGSPVVRLGAGYGLALSPDGNWALGQQFVEGLPLVLLPTGPGERRVLPTGGLHAVEAAWLDDRRIVIAGATPRQPNRLYVQNVAAGDPRPISSYAVDVNLFGRIAPTPDGRFVAAVDPTRHCMLYPVDGGAPRPISGVAEGEDPLRFSGDGRWLYVRGSRALEPPARCYRVEMATGHREGWRELMPADPAGVTGLGPIVLTEDGQTYAYTYERDLSQLFVANGFR